MPYGPTDKAEPRDVYDHRVSTRDNLKAGEIDEALATGTSQFSSKVKDGFSAIRRGDTIIIQGEVTHEWDDPYDFHGGPDGPIAAVARDHGNATEYQNMASWRQRMKGMFKVKNGKLIPQGFEWEDID